MNSRKDDCPGNPISVAWRIAPWQTSNRTYSLAANALIPNTVVQQALGRLPTGGLATGNTSINLVRTGEIFPEQVRTVDMRFAKILRFGRTRTDIGSDLYNLLNTNKATAYQQGFGFDGALWLRPTQIADARFLRFNAT